MFTCVFVPCRNDELNTRLKFDVERLNRQIERRTSQSDAEGQIQVQFTGVICSYEMRVFITFQNI